MDSRLIEASGIKVSIKALKAPRKLMVQKMIFLREFYLKGGVDAYISILMAKIEPKSTK